MDKWEKQTILHPYKTQFICVLYGKVRKIMTSASQTVTFCSENILLKLVYGWIFKVIVLILILILYDETARSHPLTSERYMQNRRYTTHMAPFIVNITREPNPHLNLALTARVILTITGAMCVV